MKKSTKLTVMGTVMMILGISLRVEATRPLYVWSVSTIPVASGSTTLATSYDTLVMWNSTQPDTSGQCAAAAGEVEQVVEACAPVSTDASVTCSSGSAKVIIANTSNTSNTATHCVATSSPLTIPVSTPVCSIPKPSIAVVDPDANGECGTNYIPFGLMTCAIPGAGVAADPSIAKTYCTCPSGQTYQTITKCSLEPLTCPAGQGSVFVNTIISTTPVTTATVTSKCVTVTDKDASGKCPDGQVSMTTTLSSPGVTGTDGVPVIRAPLKTPISSFPRKRESSQIKQMDAGSSPA